MNNLTSVLPTEQLSELFGWPEYVVFIVMLGISAGIGIMYGCFGQKQKTTSEFLMAGRNMGTFPVAMSLIARYILYDLPPFRICIFSNYRIVSSN